MFDTLLPEKSIRPAHPWANMAGRHNKKAFTFVLKLLIVSQMQILDVWDVVLGGLDVVCGGLGLTWQVNVIKMLLNFFFNY